MQFKKNRAILSAVVAAAMTSTALMSVTASAASKEDIGSYGENTYAARFLDMYEDVIVNGVQNGYLSDNNPVSGGFNIPYHSIEELICEAPDYGHETTSEAMSYIVWMAAMNDKITKDYAGKIDGVSATKDLAKAWKTLEAMIPSADQQGGFWSQSSLSAQVAEEDPHSVKTYPHEGNSSNTGENPLHSKFTSAYQSEGREYLLHWLADVDDWYGFGGSARGTKGKITFINTFQRGDQESCFETIPHPSIETKQYGDPSLGMKFAFQSSCSESWSYTNAPDAEDRAIQAVYAANRWGVSDSSVTEKAAMMGDMCRNDMYDKYYKEIGCQSISSPSAGDKGKHYLMSWYTAWGGDGSSQHSWAWQIGCSHAHQFYQNPLAAYGLLVDSGLKSGMKADGAVKDYTTSIQRQIEFYMWLQSAEGPFAGGATNCYDGKYDKYPSDVTKFYNMAYIEHPVYADPGSNHWTGNQFWATQRLAELFYLVKQNNELSSVKPGGLALDEALEKILDKWVNFFVTNTTIDDKGDYSVPASLNWSGVPDKDWGEGDSYYENKNLHVSEISGYGFSDMGCANSLADTLTYYAKAKGVEAKGVVKEGSSLEEKALYTAQQLMDRTWKLGRDEKGMSRTEHNGSLARFWDQEVYIPSGKSGTYPYGYEVKSGSKFIDFRPMYEDVEGYDTLYNAYKADKEKGAAIKESETGTDCSAFTNVEAVDLHFHRFWHAGDDMMAFGAMALLYPDVTPSSFIDESVDPPVDPPVEDNDFGNVDCSKGETKYQRVDVADAVLLARFLAEDNEAVVTEQGQKNADVNASGKPDQSDVTKILKFVARLVDENELGKA